MPPNFSTRDFLASCVILLNAGIPAEQSVELVRNAESPVELATQAEIVLQERLDAIMQHQALHQTVMPVIQKAQAFKFQIAELLLSGRNVQAEALVDEQTRILREIELMNQELLLLSQYLYPELV